ESSPTDLLQPHGKVKAERWPLTTLSDLSHGEEKAKVNAWPLPHSPAAARHRIRPTVTNGFTCKSPTKRAAKYPPTPYSIATRHVPSWPKTTARMSASVSASIRIAAASMAA